MVTLYQLAEQAEPGDRIRWKAEKGKEGDRKPRDIERIILEERQITIEAEGPRGVNARFWVKRDGDNRAFYGGNDMGLVEWAELVDDDIFAELGADG